MLDQDQLRNASRCLSEESRQLITMFRHLSIKQQNEFLSKLGSNVILIIDHLQELQDRDHPSKEMSTKC